jgi:hypothetical protein
LLCVEHCHALYLYHRPTRQTRHLHRRSGRWRPLIEEAFVGGLTEFRGAKLLNTIISDGVVASEWWFDYTHKDWGTRNYTQIAVQRWKDGKIVEEKFYYNN